MVAKLLAGDEPSTSAIDKQRCETTKKGKGIKGKKTHKQSKAVETSASDEQYNSVPKPYLERYQTRLAH